MKKSATLITTALLTFGFAAASMAADTPKSAAPAAADTATAAPTTKTKTASTPPEAQESHPAPATTK